MRNAYARDRDNVMKDVPYISLEMLPESSHLHYRATLREGVDIHQGSEETIQNHLDRWQRLRPRCLEAKNAA